MRTVVGCGIVVLFWLVGFFLLFYQAGCIGSDETVIRQATPPDGKHTAVLLEKDGDATVSVHRAVVLCEGSRGCAADGGNVVASGKDEGISNVSWEANGKLTIHYASSYTGFTNRRDAQDGVTIEYFPKGK